MRLSNKDRIALEDPEYLLNKREECSAHIFGDLDIKINIEMSHGQYIMTYLYKIIIEVIHGRYVVLLRLQDDPLKMTHRL